MVQAQYTLRMKTNRQWLVAARPQGVEKHRVGGQDERALEVVERLSDRRAEDQDVDGRQREVPPRTERRLRVADMVLKFITVRIDEKLKKIAKRKKDREKRAARKPAIPVPAPSLPSAEHIMAGAAEPGAPRPGAPMPGAPAPSTPVEKQ